MQAAKFYSRWLVRITMLMVTGMLGCRAASPASTASDAKNVQQVADEPSFEVGGLHMMAAATTESQLPFLTVESGIPVESPCFFRSKKAQQWETLNSHVQQLVQTNATSVSAALISWMTGQLEMAIAPADSAPWTMVVGDLMIRHYATQKVRLQDEQQCFTQQRRSLSGNAKVATTLIGTTAFTIQSKTPISRDLAKKMKKQGGKKGARIKIVATYPKATDERGRPVFQKGKPMFVAPDGTLVKRRDVPPMRKRPIYELQVKVPKGVYVAFGDMPNHYWKAENDAAQCEINLIFDDMTARIPQCTALNDMGFGVAMADESNKVIVKAATAEGTAEVEMTYGTVGFIQAGGTGLAWVTPRRLEEGAILEIDTVILHPTTTKSESLQPFKYHR